MRIDSLFIKASKIVSTSRIRWNISNVEFPPSIFYNQFIYCIEHNIEISETSINLFSKIESYLENGNEHYAVRLIEKMYSTDIEMISYFLRYNGKINVRRELYYTLLRIIKGSKDTFESGRNFLQENEKSLIDDKIFNDFEIIRFQVALEEKTAFKKLHTYIEDKIQNKVVSSLEFRQDEWQRYTNPVAIDDLLAIFKLYLCTPNCQDYFDRFSLPVRIASEALTNICKNNRNAELTLSVLDKIEKLDSKEIETLGGDIFYYYRLKNDILEIYYNQKSTAFNLREVLKVIEENSFAF